MTNPRFSSYIVSYNKLRHIRSLWLPDSPLRGSPVRKALYSEKEKHEKSKLAIFSLLISSNAIAVQYQDVEVTKVYAGYDDDRVFFDVNTTKLNPANCSKTFSYIIEPSRKDVKSMLSTLLTARTTGKSINVGVEEDQCFSDYPGEPVNKQ